MKRRYHDINSEDPSPIRTSYPAALPQFRSPETGRDSLSNRAPVCLDRKYFAGTDGPKTSEFAFFKKLKKDAGQRFDPHAMQRLKNQLTMLNSSDCCRVVGRFESDIVLTYQKSTEGTRLVRNISKSLEGTNIARNRSKDFRSPLPVENASSKELGSVLSIENVNSKDSRSALPISNLTRINFDSFLSPVGGAVDKSEVNVKNAFSAVEPIFSIEDWLDHYSDNKKPGGSHSDQEELFSRKRQKLLQWAHNSYPEIKELCFKGYEVVSMLLSRLLPWSNEKNSSKSAESVPLESNTKSELFAWPKSDIPSKKLYRLPTRKILEVEYTPLYLENGTSSYWSDISRETMLSNIDSTTYNNHSTHRKNLELPCCKVKEKNLTSCIEGDSTFAFPFVRHGSFLSFSSFKKPDDLHDPDGSFPGREPLLPLLEWDYVNGTLSYWSDRSRETMLYNIYSPPYNKHRTLQKNLESTGCGIREKNLISYIEGDSTFGFPLVKHGSFLPFCSFKEPDDLHDPIGSLPGREPHLPLLEWDSVNMNEKSLSATCQNTNWTLIPAVQSSWDHQQSLNKPFSSFKEPFDSHDPNGSLPGRQPYLPLLEWDVLNVNERNLSATCPNANWATIPPVQSSWDHQKRLNNWFESFDTLGLCSSPVLGNDPQDFYTLVPPNGISYGNYEFGRPILEKEEEIIVDLRHLPLNLSHSSKCLNLFADCNHYEFACQGGETSGILPSPENHFDFISKALVE